MRFPRFILNPSVIGWIRLLQRERRETARLRRELTEWQNTVRQLKGITPLFQPPPKPHPQVDVPPVGLVAKRQVLARREGSNIAPSAESILAAAEKVKSNGHA